MNFQKIKGNFFDKIILGKTGLIMPFKFTDIGVQPDWLGQIKNEAGICHSLKDFGGPAHVEMMGLIGMGNNPMVGATVAVAVSIEEAAKAGKF